MTLKVVVDACILDLLPPASLLLEHTLVGLLLLLLCPWLRGAHQRSANSGTGD
jgi:hypothetical protein